MRNAETNSLPQMIRLIVVESNAKRRERLFEIVKMMLNEFDAS